MGKPGRRQAAEALRKQREAEARRKKIVFGVAIGAAVVLIGGLLGLGIWMNREPDYEVNDPAAETTDGYAVQIGSGEAEIDIYLDYMCPACNQFETAYAEQIQSWVDDGSVTVNYHPIAILDRLSQGTEYSTRAGASAVCAADVGQQEFLDYTVALYEHQPKENSSGLTDAELKDIGAGVGLGSDWEQCVDDETYKGWVQSGTTSATEDQGVTGTPTVKVNGEKIDPADFVAEVEAAIANAS
ncbi:DsbA family protein [Glycomyces arizonensis]|uniref:DsbA family protein n=1 Tax=Glycomyces arizonensis TaxID=256035 RepID=UPI00047A0490|nr:thioredoxin domain-containing protein [Glycomyces arizonensis]